jgi:mono/diheme cytochrome c family protein
MKKILCAAAVLFVVSAAWQTAAAQERDGKTAYGEVCKKCHGVLGTPPVTMKKKYPKLVGFDAAFLGTHSADSIVKVLTKGKGDDMESFKDKLSPAEMKAVAAYVRELAGKAKPGGDK